ncbi:MAG TPA: sugar phosphate isomerase/epimerase family protein [Chloroflexota bacterium]|nr:sugar phosphate isomerase/epimerase family protein [Chloroflexota bacterium]
MTGPWQNCKDVPLRDRGSVFTDEISLDFADACATAAGAGLTFVDVRKLWGGFSHEVPKERWPEMKRILDDNGLRMGAIQSNFGKCAISGPEYEAHIAFFPTLVEQAHYFGTDVMRVFPFWNETKVRYDPPFPGGIRPNLEETLPELVRRFKPAADLARKEGVWLGFEPEHSTYSGSPQEVARIVEAIDNPHVGVAWDVNNGWDDCPAEEAYGLFRERIYNVHVKERTLTPDEHRTVRAALGIAPSGPREVTPERSAGSSTVTSAAVAPADAAARLRRQPTLLGTGAMPWGDVIRTLERDGYRGVYSIETHFGVRGTHGWPKLKAATTYFMYALRELLLAAETALSTV